ncbi:MAG: GNAT family N-acetyltransferase [Sarcina sp.]
MELRNYRETDCEEVINLFYETVHSINIKDYTKEQVNVWATKKIDIEVWNTSLINNYSIVCININKIVGFGDLRKDGYFDRLYVHKDYQNLGIATKIVSQIEKYARESNIGAIEVHSSITAKKFFVKRGYELIKKQNVKRKNQELTNYVMRKKLIKN